MPTRILFATDFHFRSMRPVARTDESFFATQLGKLEQILRLSKDVDLVIFGGDIFDRPDVGEEVQIKVMRMLGRFKRPPLTVVGQHEVYGYEGSSIEKSALGVMLESGRLQKLDCLHLDNPGIDLYGIHAYDKAVWNLPEEGGKRIVVAHKMLTDRPIPNADCIPVSSVAAVTNAHLVLSGDIHFPHETEENGCLFVNPGSISRMSIADKDRIPQVAIITVEDDGDIDCAMVPLSAKPGTMVFNMEDYAAKVASEAHTKDFVKTYASVVFSVKAEAHKIGDVLARFLKDNDVPNHTRELVNTYYKNAEKQVLRAHQEK